MNVPDQIFYSRKEAHRFVLNPVLVTDSLYHGGNLPQPVAWQPGEAVVLVMPVEAPVEPVHPFWAGHVHVAFDHHTEVFLHWLRSKNSLKIK